MQKVVRKLIPIEIKLGFLNIPSQYVSLLPSKKEKLNIMADKEEYLLYNPEYRRIFGLTSWYKKQNAKEGNVVVLEKISKNKFKISLTLEDTKKGEAERLIDISGLSSHAKGDIVEDRIKELILLHGQGLLNVYKPVSDTGVDMIVVKAGRFHPIFLQIKGRFVLSGNTLIIGVGENTFVAHPNFYIIGVYFDPVRMELNPDILFIPSIDLEKKAKITKGPNKDFLRVTASLNKNKDNKWSEFLVKKEDLANKLLEKFEEIDRYVK